MNEARKLQSPVFFTPQNRFAWRSKRVAEDLSGKTLGEWNVIQRAPNDGHTVRFYAAHTGPGGCGSPKIHAISRSSLVRKESKTTCPDCAPVRISEACRRNGKRNCKQPSTLKPGTTCKLCWGIPRGVKGHKCKKCGLERGE